MTTPLPEQLTRVFLKIRDRRSELKAAFDAEDKKLQEQQDKVKAALLEHCNTNNVESVRTDSGTFFRTTKTRFWTNDWDALNKFVIENNLPEFYEKRLNQTIVRDYIAEELDGERPDFINVSSEYQISVRAPQAKKGAK